MIDKFKDIFSDEQMLINEPMKNHTTFKTGGNADLILLPNRIQQLSEAICICSTCSIPYFIVGNGSNLLVTDNGFRGVIIKTAQFKSICVSDTVLTAESGVLLADIAKVALENSLQGFEFASGIPGSLGGAVFMNAGAYDGEMKHVLIDAVVLNQKGEVYTLMNEQMDFRYRHSKAQDDNLIVISARLQLKHGDCSEIKEIMDDLSNRRSDKQPLEMPSAGSTFKRPQGHYASKLIEDCGLRGFSIHDAQVSNKHCGFVINKGEATSKDILDLITHIKDVVKHKTGVELEPEVRIIGE